MHIISNFRESTLLPKEGTLRRSSKHNSIQSNKANRPIPTIIVGPTDTTEEIWIDGIDQLDNSPATKSKGNQPGNKDSSSNFHASLPFILENNNNNIKPQGIISQHVEWLDTAQNCMIGKLNNL